MPDPVVSLVVAVAENGIIGRAGQLPWRMPSDLRTFRRLTMGKPVVMGRKTYQSIGKPLDGRDNIVVTRDATVRAAGVEVALSIADALDLARRHAATRGVDEIMVIGGAEIFDAVMPDAGRIYFTRVHATPAGDTSFPDPDPLYWREVSREPIATTDRDDHSATLIVYERQAIHEKP